MKAVISSNHSFSIRDSVRIASDFISREYVQAVILMFFLCLDFFFVMYTGFPYILIMEVEFDLPKDKANRLKHGVGLDFAKTVLADPYRMIMLDSRFSYGEDRFISFAQASGRVWVCVYTMRNHRFRIISLRKANDREKTHYHATTGRF